MLLLQTSLVSGNGQGEFIRPDVSLIIVLLFVIVICSEILRTAAVLFWKNLTAPAEVRLYADYSMLPLWLNCILCEKEKSIKWKSCASI